MTVISAFPQNERGNTEVKFPFSNEYDKLHKQRKNKIDVLKFRLFRVIEKKKEKRKNRI